MSLHPSVDIAHATARRILADIVSNGGIVRRQPDHGDGLVRVLIEYAPGADRPRCRGLVAEAKASGATWNAVLLLLAQ